MRGRVAPIASALMILVCVGRASGEHAKITLEARAGDREATARVDQTPPDWGKTPRPVLNALRGEAIRVRYDLTNVDPHKVLRDVVVHFYVVRQEKVGQRELPTIDEEVVLETAFDLDFRPGGRAGARSTFRIDRPGVYLIRVETGKTGSDHEHFSAIDLVVGP